jgi:hypothetical protein
MRPRAIGIRLPAGPVLALLGVAIAVALGFSAQISKQLDWSKSLILAATVAAAILNWLWARQTRTTDHPPKEDL